MALFQNVIASGMVALTCVFASIAEAAAAPTRLDYEVVRDPGPTADRFVVTLRFRGDSTGTTLLRLPSAWASAQHAERGIDDLVVLTKGARLQPTDAPDVLRIFHPRGAQLMVRYVLHQIYEGEPSATSTTQFLPVIRHGYFEWIGWTAWIIPYANDRVVEVRLRFRKLPADWSFASSFGLDPGHVVFNGQVGEFRSALFVGGDFRLRSRPALGGPVITAVRGDWSFRDSDLADRTAKIINEERAFWRDDSQKFYLVALLPLTAQPSSQSIAGTGLTHSFVTWATPANLEDLNFLWAHEYFHNWNNAQLGDFPEPQPKMYWFSEGFTDYYMNVMQLRLGLMNLAQYAAAYDDVLRTLSQFPQNRMPNDAVAAGFFSDPQGAGRLPYLRGVLLAARWNAEIVAHSDKNQSLDDAMRILLAQYRAGSKSLDTARIVDVMRLAGVDDPTGDLARYIDQGAVPLLRDGALGKCITIGQVIDHRSDLGFDRTASEQGSRFVDVRNDGPAYAAGIRETQQLRSLRAFGRGSPVEVGVSEPPDNTVRIIRYLPVGPAFSRQSAVLTADLDDASKDLCLQQFGVRALHPVSTPERRTVSR